MSDEERRPWDRRAGESTLAYEGFRQYRDLGPTRTMDRLSISNTSARRWSGKWDWVARAGAWDDELRMVEDAERVEAIRTMHRTHQRAGRAATQIALRALQQLRPESMSPGEVVRLLDLGARLERDGLTTAVEGQGVGDLPGEDPWERIARELAGT